MSDRSESADADVVVPLAAAGRRRKRASKVQPPPPKRVKLGMCIGCDCEREIKLHKGQNICHQHWLRRRNITLELKKVSVGAVLEDLEVWEQDFNKWLTMHPEVKDPIEQAASADIGAIASSPSAQSTTAASPPAPSLRALKQLMLSIHR